MGTTQDFIELKKKALENKLIGICSSCGCGYYKSPQNINSNICNKCMEGVIIPTF